MYYSRFSRENPVQSGPCGPCETRPGEFHPRKCPQIRAFAVIEWSAGRGRIPLRPDSAASYSRKKFTGKLSKNPVNLPKFIEFYGNSAPVRRAESRRHVDAAQTCAFTPNAGNCRVERDRGGAVERVPSSGQRTLPPRSRSTPNPPPQRSFSFTSSSGGIAFTFLIWGCRKRSGKRFGLRARF